MTQCIVMKWVGNLNNVPDGILQAREEIELKVREAAELNEKAAVIRNAAYMESLKLESHIRTWCRFQKAAALAHGLGHVVCSRLLNKPRWHCYAQPPERAGNA